ncbi:hypothetical protein MLC59_02080 [Marinobacter bryozoorum]|jgi:hypothetical protein|uniref:phage head-tail joining protein n=1 Tax=Marinobacter bryozoorum TaxID=256324 RepID=UPI00200621CF|nr:hypothetical protein [Marinobacter bryozoorum]MCK7542958.1 hypothetical protein [Marinobacter bryozoorum]
MSFTASDLDAINRAIALGERRVTFNDRTVEYRDIDELLRARDAIRTELARSESGSRRRIWPMRGTGF